MFNQCKDLFYSYNNQNYVKKKYYPYKNQPLSIEQLMAIKFYTDYSELCTELRKSFRFHQHDKIQRRLHFIRWIKILYDICWNYKYSKYVVVFSFLFGVYIV